MPLDATRFELTPKQKEVRAVFATAARYLLVYGGSRSGKTAFICYAILVRALKAPGSRHAIFRRHSVAAKQSIAKDTLPKIASLAFPDLELKWKEQDGYFILPNGSEIWISGLDDKDRVDKVLGREFVTIYFNEASEIPLASFSVALTRLAQKVEQVNGKPLSQKCYVDLNPTTAAHWTYQMWINGVHPDGEKKLDDSKYAHIVVNPMDNLDNLDPEYIASLEALPERQKRRFFDGKFTADDDNALWRRSYIQYETEPPEMSRVVIAVDPATTNEVGSDETGIVAVGLGVDGKGYVLSDESGKFRPEAWARRAISTYHTFDGDKIVGEVNQGGDMVEATIKAQSKGSVIPYKSIHAFKGKYLRAEHVAALYEQNKVRHVDRFHDLEDQMCTFTIGFDRKAQGYSPDRLDALVYALTELFPGLTRKKVDDGPVTVPNMRRLSRR